MKSVKNKYKIFLLFTCIFLLGFFAFSRYISNTINEVKSLEQTVPVDSSYTKDPKVIQIIE